MGAVFLADQDHPVRRSVALKVIKPGLDSTLVVDTRSDINSLGVLLYELLTGSAPLQRQRVRGDLDWIVMKAMEKDAARRYETANGMATDIGRHLESDPVEAHHRRCTSCGNWSASIARRS